MPEITSCPECEKKLRVPDDLLGKKVRCPGCGSMFTAKVARPAEEEEEGEDEPPRRPKLSRKEGITERREAPARGRGRDRDEDEEDEDEAPRRRRRRDEEEDDEDDRPRSRRGGDYEDEDAHRRRRRRAVEDDDDEDYDDRPRGRDTQGWRGVRAGLNLVVIGGWLNLATLAVAVLGGGLLLLLGVGAVASAAANAGPGRPPPSGGFAAFGAGACIVGCTVVLLALAAVVLDLIGSGMCMQTPPSRASSARGLCIAAFCCKCAGILLYIVAFIVNMSGGITAGPGASPAAMVAGAGAAQVLMLGCYALCFASFVLWIFYLRGACLQLRNSAVASKVLTFFIAEMIFVVLAIMMAVVLVFVVGLSLMGAKNPAGAAGSIGAGVIAMFVIYGLIFLVSIGLYVWYILIVTDVRGVVERQLARR